MHGPGCRDRTLMLDPDGASDERPFSKTPFGSSRHQGGIQGEPDEMLEGHADARPHMHMLQLTPYKSAPLGSTNCQDVRSVYA
jgi:hypothetical protein